MRYAQIRKMDISNGVGIGISLFVQGCRFHCPGCFNPETWDFGGGQPWTQQIENDFVLNLAARPYVQRISFLGGEPLADENVQDVLRVMCRLKALYPEKKIWVYTGYTAETIFRNASASSDPSKEDLYRLQVCSLADVLVDGPFTMSNQDLLHQKILWAGSTNQRVIDTQRSRQHGRIVLLEETEA